MGSRKIHFFLGLSTRVVVADGVAVLVAAGAAVLFSTSASASSKHRNLDIFVQCFPGVAEILIHSQRSRAAPTYKALCAPGKVLKTVFLREESLRREISRGLTGHRYLE